MSRLLARRSGVARRPRRILDRPSRSRLLLPLLLLLFGGGLEALESRSRRGPRFGEQLRERAGRRPRALRASRSRARPASDRAAATARPFCGRVRRSRRRRRLAARARAARAEPAASPAAAARVSDRRTRQASVEEHEQARRKAPRARARHLRPGRRAPHAPSIIPCMTRAARIASPRRLLSVCARAPASGCRRRARNRRESGRRCGRGATREARTIALAAEHVRAPVVGRRRVIVVLDVMQRALRRPVRPARAPPPPREPRRRDRGRRQRGERPAAILACRRHGAGARRLLKAGRARRDCAAAAASRARA